MLATLCAVLRRKNLLDLFRAVCRITLHDGISGLYQNYRKYYFLSAGYNKWVLRYDTLGEQDRKDICNHIPILAYQPLISILTPVYNTPKPWLRKAIESVRAQLYPNWELCIADDASTLSDVRAVLEEYQRLDKRIKVTYRDRNGHISAASNSALELATGEFIALLDHDDELPEHALYMVALTLERFPNVNMIYSDEDKIDEQGRRFGPYFKPDWNPELFTAQNMVSHLGVYRTNILRAVGGFREGVEGSQDWDLALRVAEHIPPTTIHHIPHILYHWRAISGSAAIGHEEKSYVASASQRVVREHLQRINQSASVEPAFGSFVRVRYPLPAPAHLVSIILLGDSTNSEELIRRTHYPALEIISCPQSNEEAPAETINQIVKQARGELLCILDAGLLPVTEDWLDQLAAHATRPEVGAVGPMQLDTNGHIQGALTVLCSMPGSTMVSWSFHQGLHHQDVNALQQNVSVLAPGCLVLRTATFRMMNGFDAKNYPYTLFYLDLCLRLVQAGYRNLWTPYSKIISTGSRTTCFDACNQEETEQFRIQWQAFLDHDPAHNPNLSCDGEFPFPVSPPRVNYPWRKQ
jgi:cellulose synthase/poly-beta-1,6-N-acetylglucosamine synthase-like glycosyltransferase